MNQIQPLHPSARHGELDVSAWRNALAHFSDTASTRAVITAGLVASDHRYYFATVHFIPAPCTDVDGFAARSHLSRFSCVVDRKGMYESAEIVCDVIHEVVTAQQYFFR